MNRTLLFSLCSDAGGGGGGGTDSGGTALSLSKEEEEERRILYCQSILRVRQGENVCCVSSEKKVIQYRKEEARLFKKIRFRSVTPNQTVLRSSSVVVCVWRWLGRQRRGTDKKQEESCFVVVWL